MPTATLVAPSHRTARDRTLVPVRDLLWRVTRADGEILGHIEAIPTELGVRYAAKRANPRLQRFVVLGEFWQIDEAIACL